ncbi:unnamed protein product [Porites lobata]|uniref:Uncharacterized protein n=1 Tax=Porites lobata TaxID=104759 RepID=A0ABN8NEH8_9CNID|nr:unnamed protein product [Porites lobata]
MRLFPVLRSRPCPCWCFTHASSCPLWPFHLVSCRLNSQIGVNYFCCRFLRNNRIASITTDTFASLTELKYLFLSANQIPIIPYRAFYKLTMLERVMLTDNPTQKIETEAFKLGSSSLNM